ncbi:MAG: radical SAM domain-containing protein, putative pyruvate formate lyase activating enzyme [Deltaproteobacteria bacterium CSP1-8]|nr:MAG: radical SAM domain-containing protein, putative pyruvate formate lyase activating enzyme [Deltaproteobacteria bacterium CSP1-8]
MAVFPNLSSLAERAERLNARLSECDICPRRCRVNRKAGERGVCRVGGNAAVASFGPHFGEEAPLVGNNGSGTVFFSGCNLRCVFCQNYEISHMGEGGEVSAERLAGIFLSIQRMGCHNLNLVTPTHVTSQIVEALSLASSGGLSIPVVYNCGGYESVDTLQELEGVVDIYMPDVKFLDAEPAGRYCDAPDYPEVVRAALTEMDRQVGPLSLDLHGIALRGVLVRHLVMPGEASTTRRVIDFLADEIGKDTYLNLMHQYRPCGRALEFPEIGRRTAAGEWREARDYALEKGMFRLAGG